MELENNEYLVLTNHRLVMRKCDYFPSAAVAPNLYDSILPCLSCSETNNLFAFCHCAINVLGSYYAGIKLTPLDMSPNFAATLMGIANGIGSFTGIVAPFIKHSFVGWVGIR